MNFELRFGNPFFKRREYKNHQITNVEKPITKKKTFFFSLWKNEPYDLFSTNIYFILHGLELYRFCIKLSILYWSLQLEVYDRQNWSLTSNGWVVIEDDAIVEENESDNVYWKTPPKEETPEYRHRRSRNLRLNKHRKNR